MAGFVDEDDKMGWTASMFWPFSIVCLILTGGANPRRVDEWKEKAIILLCGLLGGITPLFASLTWIGLENESTTKFMHLFARIGRVASAIILVMFPPAYHHLASIFSVFSSREIH